LALFDSSALVLRVQLFGQNVSPRTRPSARQGACALLQVGFFSADNFSSRTTLPCFCKSRAVISLRARVKSCAALKAYGLGAAEVFLEAAQIVFDGRPKIAVLCRACVDVRPERIQMPRCSFTVDSSSWAARWRSSPD
jgi:hypothetical protein